MPSRKRTPKRPLIPTQIVPSIERAALSPRAVLTEFNQLLAQGARWEVAGRAARRPRQLLENGHAPKHRLDLFGMRFYLANVRQNPELRFFVAYVVRTDVVRTDVVQTDAVQTGAAQMSGRLEGSQTRANQNSAELKPIPPAARKIHPRIFYKDLSLVWRSASHFSNDDGLWIGKGDVETVRVGEEELTFSREETTDLPVEMQAALESLLSWVRRPRRDERIIGQVLREASPDRIAPFADFSRPRKRARENPANRIHGGRKIARFRRKHDPTSLVIARGFEPDFDRGILETSVSRSRLYGGELKRHRILSVNKKIQYLFLSGPAQVWIMPPQALSTELSSYGVRTVDVLADDDLFIPGFEYHYWEDATETESGEPELYSQIPPGFAGRTCPHDDAKADASPWLDRLPIIQAFRKKVLGQRRHRPADPVAESERAGPAR